jgi:hypothetical protein
MSLGQLFNSLTAIVFFDVTPTSAPTQMYKVVAYVLNYNPDLKNISGSNNVLPYRELYSKADNNNDIKFFRGFVSGMSLHVAPLQELSSNSCS